MAQKLDELNVGGEGKGWEMIISLLVIAILVFIINYLLKHWLLKKE
jgi:hypothetical protein